MALLEPTEQPPVPRSHATASEARADRAEIKRNFRPEGCSEHLRLVSTADESAPLWDAAERFVYDEYRAVGYCEESPKGWVEEAEPFRHGSTLHVMLDGEQVVGTIRTMFGPYDELPIGRFGHDIPVPSGRLAEVGSLAVSRDLRGLGVANELHRAAVQQVIASRVPAFCMLVEPWSIEFFRDVYGLPLVQTAPPRDYMGSLTVPAIVDISEMLESFSRERVGMYHWITEGLDPSLWADGSIPIVLD